LPTVRSPPRFLNDMPSEHIPAMLSPGLQNRPWANIFNLLACPTEVFEDVASAPANFANWRIPTLLVAFAAILFTQFGPLGPSTHLTAAAPSLDPTPALRAGYWPILSCLMILVVSFGASLWSAFILWFIGRVFLRARVPWLKALEIVGLIGTVTVL